LFPLLFGVLAVKEDIFICGIKFLGQLHFDACVCSESDVAASIQFEELSEDKTRWTSANHQY